MKIQSYLQNLKKKRYILSYENLLYIYLRHFLLYRILIFQLNNFISEMIMKMTCERNVRIVYDGSVLTCEDGLLTRP